MSDKKRVLLTGSSGFLGKYIRDEYISEELEILNRISPGDHILDLSQNVPKFSHRFDLVIHNAGLAHTAFGNFFEVNVQGTRNLLKGLSKSPPNYFVFISSVSVYGRIEGEYLSEKCPVLATDEYGMSKIQAEAEIMEWCQYHQVCCTILRLPLVVGPKPPGNLGSMVYAIKRGFYVNVSGGQAKKSMVLAGDVAKFILPASRIGGIFHLTDGEHPTFYQLSHVIARQLNRKGICSIPFVLAMLMARIGDLFGTNAPLNSDKLIKITSNLTFDDSLAREKFGWTPRSVLENFKI
ncbi:NAD-dependent epimerase/dehydratase family protein [Aquirufa sp. OSTEICH-129V]|uniref:NAD-dependent epimerase/dehydratase family protein n=1 Tax=Aquirufa avitistagni TaxID=3104728 RepID=A0ABW6DEP8_9BACT